MFTALLVAFLFPLLSSFQIGFNFDTAKNGFGGSDLGFLMDITVTIQLKITDPGGQDAFVVSLTRIGNEYVHNRVYPLVTTHIHL